MNKKHLLRIGIFLSLCAFSPVSHANTDLEVSMPSSVPNAHQFSFKSIDGDAMPLSEFSGKVILIVNTASKCGLTGQYKDLQSLHDTYKDKGLVVLGVPSGDFAGQEFEEEGEVKNFTEEKFQITFPLTQITHVKGSNAHPFYEWAKQQGGFLSGPKWNFHKYLIDTNGNYIAAFGSRTSPTAAEVIKAIETALPKTEGQ